MVPVKKILVLPDAGPQNPFQYQMIDFLNKNGSEVVKAPGKRFFATLSAFKKHNPDILYYDWIQSFILGKTLFITLLKCICFISEIVFIVNFKKLPVIHTLHNIGNHKRLWPTIEKIVYKWFLKRCTKIRVYSEETKAKVASLFGINTNKIYVVQDIPYHYYYPNKVSKTESRAYIGIDMNKFIFLFIGMIKPYKGIEDLIQIFQEIATSEDILLIAGASDSSQYEREITKLASKSNRIIFHNKFIEKDVLQFYMNAADIVVLPFKNIEHSGSIDLAMSFKKPVITLKTFATQHLLAHQEYLLFQTTEQLGEKLIKARDMNLRSIGESNYQIADQSNYKDFVLLFENL